MYWLLGKIWFTELFASKYWHIFMIHYQKITSISIYNQIRKVLKDWETLKLTVAGKSFLKFKNYLKAWILSLATNTLNYFLEVTCSIHSFLRECLPKYSDNCTSVYFSRQCCLLLCSRHALCILPISSHRILQRHTLTDWHFMKLITFTGSSGHAYVNLAVYDPCPRRMWPLVHFVPWFVLSWQCYVISHCQC